ncbi:MAG: hypothetical protein K9K37_08905 [Desulfocapsa sp.]|nr:hypothetical protein [Desulfocapsa sp.]
MKNAPPARTNKEMMSPEKPKELEARPSERMKPTTAEHKGRVAEPSRGRQGKGSMMSPPAAIIKESFAA